MMSMPSSKECRAVLSTKASLDQLPARRRLLIFIVAYHAETTIRNVLTRIPHGLAERYETEVLIIDDASNDQTFERGHEVRRENLIPFPVTVLFNPVNQGYGKIGYF